MQLVVASLKRIQARAYNNVALIELADHIRQLGHDARVDGDAVRVIVVRNTTTKIFSVRSINELAEKQRTS
jgi:hypothetical protein